MKRVLKWLGWIALTVVALLVIAFGVAFIYKPEIVAAVKEELNKNVNGSVDFSDITLTLFEEFPEVSVTLHDVSIKGPRYAEDHREFLRAGKVYVRVGLAPLLMKTVSIRSIRITKGEVFVYRSRSGATNLDVFKRPKVTDTVTVTSNEPVDISFHDIEIEDVGVYYRDSIKNKMVGLHFEKIRNEISETDSSLQYHVSGKINFEGLTLNPLKGGYLKGKETTVSWNIESMPGKHKLILHPSTIQFQKSTVQMAGRFDFTKPGSFELNIASDKLDYAEGVSILTEALQSKLNKYDIAAPVNLNVKLKGQLADGGEPDVDVAFAFDNSHVTVGKITSESLTVDGRFSNHVDSTKLRDDHNSLVEISRASGILKGYPINASATIMDLIDPSVKLNSTMNMELRELLGGEDTTALKVKSGKFAAHIEYDGKLKELLDSTTNKYSGSLSGAIRIKDGNIQYLPRSQNFQNIDIALRFDRNRVSLDSITLQLNKSPIDIRGEIVGFVPFFAQPKGKGSVRLKVHSPSLDLMSLIQKAAATPPVKKSAPAASKQGNASRGSLLTKLYQKLEFEMDLRIDRLLYRNVNASQLKGRIVLVDDNLSAKAVSMHLADGDIAFSGTMGKMYSKMSPIYLKSSVRHADIKKFFYSFDNFKMTTLTYKNLEGKIDTEVVLWAWVDDEFKVNVPSINSQIDLKIKNGRIVDFEPLQNMSNFLMKNRDFGNVQFGEIRSHVAVRGTEMDISKMEIESSVLRLFVAGRYSLKDSTDLSVQIPLSNLKKRDKNYKPSNVGVDAKVGPSVFLHIYKGSDGKMAIAYDPFKRHVPK